MTIADIRITIGTDPVAKKVIEDGLKSYNVDAIGAYRYSNFELYAHDGNSRVIGGMFGNSGMDWLYVDFFWLDPSQRGSGLGSRLLTEAEAEAKRRNCVGVYLYTYSFQAPDFYQKNGFTVMGVLEDCPIGHRKIYLSKRLAAP